MTLASRIPKWGARAAVAAAAAVTTLLATGASAQPACVAGVAAPYCKSFVHYEPGAKPLDQRIAEGLGVKTGSETRSIGLIVAVDTYPNLPGANVPAAAVDAQRLTDFLVKDQKFDEVILLQNGVATKDTIDWFLTVYLPSRALDFPSKARLLIAYTGHGTYETGTSRPDFVLSKATSLTDDPADLYQMSAFSANVQGLATKYFHVLSLINACYGGNFFISAMSGGDPNGWNEAGAYALTAGDLKTTVPSINQAWGSVFFDLLIGGVQTGEADDEYFRYFATYGENGEPLQQDGIARTGAVETFLSTAYDRINHDRQGKQAGFEPLSHPFIGLAQPARDTAGGFFFLSSRQAGAFNMKQSVLQKYAYPPRPGGPAAAPGSFGLVPESMPMSGSSTLASATGYAGGQTPSGVAAPSAMELPIGPVSSVKGHPEIKVFKPPELYPTRGFDLSAADGAVDMAQVGRSEHPKFMYARAIGWSGPDRSFDSRWAAYAGQGVDRGAYLKYDFCRTPAQQLQTFSKVLPPDPSNLPPAIELVTPEQNLDPGEFACWKSSGPENAKRSILQLASIIETAYGKRPLLAGNSYNLGVLTDDRSDRYMLWLHAYGKQTGSMTLKGRNPWTLWQYSGSLDVRGVGPATTGDVFFGTAEQYKAFKLGTANVGLQATN